MFCKDNRQENLLTLFGVAWRYTNAVTFGQLAPNWEQANMGRTQSVVETVILEYAARTESGSSAPAPILRKTAKGYEVLDGVQRLSAEQMLGTTAFSAYVVETDSDLKATQIRVFANHLLAGHPESPDWNRKRAIQLLIIEGGMSIDEVARLGGWKRRDVEEDKLCIDYGYAVRSIGGPDQMPKGVLLKISEYAKVDDFRVSPQPIADFCNDLKKGRFNNGESEPHIRDFFGVNRNNRKTLHDQFVKHLSQFREDSEVSTRMDGRKPQKRQDDIKLRGAMKTVLTITDDLVTLGTHIAYVDEFHAIWNRVDGNLKRLGKRIPAKITA